MANDCLQVVEEWVVTRDKERERAVTDLTEAAEVRRRGLCQRAPGHVAMDTLLATVLC